MRDRSMKGGSRQKKTPVRVMRAGVSGGGRLSQIAQEAVYQPDAETAGSLRIEGTGLAEHIHAGDVQMCPRGFAGQKFLEEAGGSNRTGSAPVGDVFDIGHIRFNQFAVGVGQRKAPQLFARLFAGNGQQFGQDVVVAEQTGHLVAQRYDNRAGQRGEVDDALRLIFLST